VFGFTLMVERLQTRRRVCTEEDDDATEKWGVCAGAATDLYCFDPNLLTSRVFGKLRPTVAEPSKLYGPHLPVIVLQTSDCSTRKLYDPSSLSGVLGKPNSSTFSFRAGYITEDIVVLK
jgi:hypothetical protein